MVLVAPPEKGSMGRVYSCSDLPPGSKSCNDKQNRILRVAMRNQMWHLVIFYFLGSIHVLSRGVLTIPRVSQPSFSQS